MLARIVAMSLLLGALALVVPGDESPVGEAAAYCIQIDQWCINPCYGIVGTYDRARDAAGLEDKTPELYCMD